MPTQETDLSPLYQVLGDQGLILDKQARDAAGTDWRGVYHGPVLAIARPETAQQAADIVMWARKTQTPLVPQGGNSSLAGGSVPQAAGQPAIVLSSTRLRKIRKFDPKQRLLVAETGLILQEVQDQVAPLQVPIDLGGRGSAQLGGLLACHAGGLNVIRYGSLRSQVRGLEAVLPNGQIWHGLNEVKKDNSGFDLKSLLIGSEGTLGFITAVCLQLHAPAHDRMTCLIGLDTPNQALDILWDLEEVFAGQIYAAELMPKIGMARALAHKPDLASPFGTDLPPYSLLIEVGLRSQLAEAETNLILSRLMNVEGQVIVAQTLNHARTFWDLRENLVLAQSSYGPSIKHDVCVPLPAVPDLLMRGCKLAETILPGCIPVPFGHVGDGSFHFNISCPPGGHLRMHKCGPVR